MRDRQVSTKANEAFGELLVRRVRDPLVEEALRAAAALGDDGSEAVAAIDRVLADVLHMFEEPALGHPGNWRTVPLRILAGEAIDGTKGDISTDALVDLVATSDGLVGDLIGWVEKFSAFPQMPGLVPVKTMPKDYRAYRRAVRDVVKRLVAGEISHPALGTVGELAMPPGGEVVPELHETTVQDEGLRWIGPIRLFQRSPDGPRPTALAAWVEVVERPDQTVEARLVNVVDVANDRADA